MEDRCPDCGTKLPQGTPSWVRKLTAADVMTKDPVTVGPEDSLMRAYEVMRLHHVRRLPIAVGDVFMGIVAQGDLKAAQPSTLSDSQEDFNRVRDETPVSRIMIQRPATIEEGTTLLEVARTLQQTKYGALPVLKDGKLVGIVTDNDVIRCLGDLLEQGG